MAMALNDSDLAVASEGSFGPHPSIIFVPADEELLLFIDRRNDLKIFAQQLSTDTNLNGEEIHTKNQLEEFARRSLFPSHGLIMRKSKDDFDEVVKGVTDWDTLLKTFHQLKGIGSSVYVETDMRAMYNPTRMKVIEQVTHKLVKKIKSCCPQCQAPGFGVTKANQGLRCDACHFPTRSIQSYTYTCQRCSFTKDEMYPFQKTAESPMFCDMCNP